VLAPFDVGSPVDSDEGGAHWKCMAKQKIACELTCVRRVVVGRLDELWMRLNASNGRQAQVHDSTVLVTIKFVEAKVTCEYLLVTVD
jgi:hypothetical protein